MLSYPPKSFRMALVADKDVIPVGHLSRHSRVPRPHVGMTELGVVKCLTRKFQRDLRSPAGSLRPIKYAVGLSLRARPKPVLRLAANSRDDPSL
jgi:hypothetical protein